MRTIPFGLLAGLSACTSIDSGPTDSFVESDSPSVVGDSPADSESLDSLPAETDPLNDSDTAEDSDLPTLYAPTLYPPGQTHSPVTPWSTNAIRDILSTNANSQPDVFAKVGASSTVSSSTLFCFAGNNVHLDAYGNLQGSLDYFLDGDADGTTPFDRVSEAALSGAHAGWAIDGDPAPIDVELAAIAPQWALIHYGANDMGWGETYEIALDLYFRNMSDLMDRVQAAGAVPILTGISRRTTNESADEWVDTWNAAIRGMAQDRQVPFIDLEFATSELNNYGVSGDGLHLNGYSGGTCVFTPAGLEYGYNVRNLIVLQAFDRVHRTLHAEEPAPDETIPFVGDGSGDTPWIIPQFPFSHVANTAESTFDELDVYTGCNATQDESGPEYTYRFVLQETTWLRFTVSDRGTADIDLHLLDDSGTAEGCIARGHRSIAGELGPGEYRLVLDTWVSDEAWTGEYLVTLTPCLASDDACANPLEE